MPKFLDTRGNTTLGIGICGRCSRKFTLSSLMSDPDITGLFVCVDDLDTRDPYRLPARQADRIALDHPRPDIALSVVDTQLQAPQQFDNLTRLSPYRAWQASTLYALGDEVVPYRNVDANPKPDAGPALGILGPFQIGVSQIGVFTIDQPSSYVYACIMPGTSGDGQPDFPLSPGETFDDGTVRWINIGLRLS